ncbi:MAG TPA: iron-sulfur cluster assembly scaffold protein [Blastocatellia bacterium]|nr:iron-sulfur cluster assembly scaffold protein [Blastocatellia bacterium]
MPTLYSDVLLDHFRNPRNFGSLPAPDISYEIFNPLCGDRIRIEIEVNGDTVRAARFQGDGCAISLAAASMLTEMIVGSNITGDEIVSGEELLSALKSEIQPTRVKCALLPLEALRSGVKLYQEDESVER